ncbi:hypothetical protein CDO44_04760 [Pigmentiphaga sp. NML080357]|nr:hypothetical protein CDO44_04760 [Pigmentiphaga sp. NML080357]
MEGRYVLARPVWRPASRPSGKHGALPALGIGFAHQAVVRCGLPGRYYGSKLELARALADDIGLPQRNKTEGS